MGAQGQQGQKKDKGRGAKKRCPSNSGWIVHVLQLKDGCYYIGKTRNKRGRRAGHFFSESTGVEWTRAHTPISVEEEINVPDVCLPAGCLRT